MNVDDVEAGFTYSERYMSTRPVGISPANRRRRHGEEGEDHIDLFKFYFFMKLLRSVEGMINTTDGHLTSVINYLNIDPNNQGQRRARDILDARKQHYKTIFRKLAKFIFRKFVAYLIEIPEIVNDKEDFMRMVSFNNINQRMDIRFFDVRNFRLYREFDAMDGTGKHYLFLSIYNRYLESSIYHILYNSVRVAWTYLYHRDSMEEDEFDAFKEYIDGDKYTTLRDVLLLYRSSPFTEDRFQDKLKKPIITWLQNFLMYNGIRDRVLFDDLNNWYAYFSFFDEDLLGKPVYLADAPSVFGA